MIAVALVGMPGAGKSEAAAVFEKSDFSRIRFGNITDDEVRRRGLELNEQNEKIVREDLRKKHGMAAYAKLNIPKIDAALKNGNAVLDGLYSWEEYLLLKEKYEEQLKVVAVYSPPLLRYSRLAGRDVRPLTRKEAESRDRAEIEKLNKGGPIAMADCVIINEGTLDELQEQARKVIRWLKG